ncbi:hypothetical protein HYV64_02305 [Candidatus Shapirobacteria bacterium]|nr:hypothetical protein [Candidatus Shapirobacteria bacterium]
MYKPVITAENIIELKEEALMNRLVEIARYQEATLKDLTASIKGNNNRVEVAAIFGGGIQMYKETMPEFELVCARLVEVIEPKING